MKTLIALLLATSAAHAAPTTADVFKDVTFAQPKCFAKTYSRTDLRAHPKQTVQALTAKLMKYSADESIPSAGLKLQLRIKGQPFHAEFSCFDNDGEAMCAIECDGGSVKIADLQNNQLTLKSNGFLIQGGCDGDDGEKTKFLKALKGGDDLFRLSAKACEN